MTTPRHTAHRPLAPRVAGPREPVDPARIGRRVVRRRAKGAVAAALDDAWFDARQVSRHENLADDARGPAELAEWERIDQLLAAAPAGTVYDPDADDFVQAELAADAAAAAREAELREAARIAARADELQALRELGTLEQIEPRDGDEAARDELTGEPAATSKPTSTPGSRTPWPRTSDTTATPPPAKPPPASCRRLSSRTPRCSPNSPAWSPAPTSTSWRSRPGSPPPNLKPLARSPRSSLASGRSTASTITEVIVTLSRPPVSRTPIRLSRRGVTLTVRPGTTGPALDLGRLADQRDTPLGATTRAGELWCLKVEGTAAARPGLSERSGPTAAVRPIPWWHTSVRALEASMSEQPAPADTAARQLEPAAADAVRAYAAKTRADADRFAVVLEDIATNGLPDPEQCTPWEELREAHLTRLAAQRPAVA